MIPGIATAQIQKFTNGGKVSDDDEQYFVTLSLLNILFYESLNRYKSLFQLDICLMFLFALA